MPQSTTAKKVRLVRTEQYNPQGTEGAKSNFVTNVSWEDWVAKGGPVAHYRKVIAAGGNATTGLTGAKSEFVSTPGNIRFIQQRKNNPSVSGRFDYIVTGDLCQSFGLPPYNPTPLLQTSADNLALKRYYDHINSVNTYFSGMVFAGELRESLALIKSPARALRNGISSYLSFVKKRGPGKTKRKRPSFVRDTWLEYSFGWRPIISDIDSAIKAFYLSRAARPIFEMVKGTAEQNKLLSYGQSSSSYSMFTWAWDNKITESAYTKYFGIQFSNGQGVSDAHKYGFHPAEFVPTVWELIPYSFLVDYFTNIGQIVSSWSYRFLVNGWTASTRRQTLIAETSNSRVLETPDDELYRYDYEGAPGGQTSRTTYVQRTPDMAPPLPTLELKVPGMDTRWVNILALSKQLDGTRRALRS